MEPTSRTMDFQEAVDQIYENHKQVVSMQKVQQLLMKHVSKQNGGKAQVSVADFNKVNEKIGKACAVATKSNALSRRTSDQMSDFSKLVTARNSNSMSPSRNQVI